MTEIQLPRLRVGSVFSVGTFGEGRVLALAAAAPQDSSDPVDLAVIEMLHSERPGMHPPTVEAGDSDPASPGRRYSLVRVRDFPFMDESRHDIVVMRGDLDTVLKAATITRETRTVVKRNAVRPIKRGSRVLGVAYAHVNENDEVGEFAFQGYVTVRPAEISYDEPEGPGTWMRVSLWSVSLRYQHWINVAMVFILSCTGYIIMDPFFGPTPQTSTDTGYLMGWVRLIHFSAAFIWLVVGATRIIVAFTSPDRYLRWPTLWPLKSREDVRNLGRVIQHYVFIRREAPLYVAHNPLQQLTYTLVYIACAVQMATGFMLYGLYYQSSPFWAFVSAPIHWFSIPGVRLFHTLTMFGLWAFVIVHVYLAVRADSLERHGGLSAMINGGVWLRRGAKPVDAPEVE